MADVESKIPPDLCKELRALAHDLSNSLETVLQAAYLLAQSEMSEQSHRWIEMIDQATKESVRLNRRLREILRSQ